MASLNRVVLVGRLTKDPEQKKTPSGNTVVSFHLAVDNNLADHSASFIPCTVWNKNAEFLAKYGRKGSLIGVDGRLRQRSYTSKQTNTNVSTIEVIIDSIQLLQQKNNTETNISTEESESSFETSSISHEGIDSSDDDLPF